MSTNGRVSWSGPDPLWVPGSRPQISMVKRRVDPVRVAAVLALLVCGACQTYRPLELGAVQQGARLRVTVARPIPVRLREITVERTTLVDGEAVGVNDGQLVLSALWVEREGGIGTLGEGWTVTLPVGSVRTLSERRFSWWRTALVGALGVVGTAVGWRSFGGGGGGESQGRPPVSGL